MLDLDIAWLIKELDGLGLKLSATRRVDGSFGLNKWRTMNYWENAPLAEALWAKHVGDNADVITGIAEFVAESRARSHREPQHALSMMPVRQFAIR